jgi:hypothetical protein
VTTPSEAPTTLYYMVNLRYGNDPDLSDNSMTISTYVLQVGYNQTEAAKSFEYLLHTMPSNNSVSFEKLMLSQAAVASSFEDLLTNASNTAWDTEYTEENRTALFWSYVQILYDETFLFASCNVKIEESWMSLCGYT